MGSEGLLTPMLCSCRFVPRGALALALCPSATRVSGRQRLLPLTCKQRAAFIQGQLWLYFVCRFRGVFHECPDTRESLGYMGVQASVLYYMLRTEVPYLAIEIFIISTTKISYVACSGWLPFHHRDCCVFCAVVAETALRRCADSRDQKARIVLYSRAIHTKYVDQDRSLRRVRYLALPVSRRILARSTKGIPLLLPTICSPASVKRSKAAVFYSYGTCLRKGVSSYNETSLASSRSPLLVFHRAQ